MRNRHGGVLVAVMSLSALVGCSGTDEATSSETSAPHPVACTAADDRVWLSGGPDTYEAPRLVVAGDGADPAGVINPDWFITSPSPSPDGATIAVTRADTDHSSASPNTSIWTMAPDGSDAHDITRGTGDWQPDWSPDGATLVFSHYDRDESQWHLATVPATGGPVTVLTDVEAGDYSPKFSPDGERIAFIRIEEIPNNLQSSVWTMRPDGSGTEKVADLPVGNVGTLAWSPDGEHVIVGRHEGLSSISLADGAVTVISTDAVAAAWSSDGKRMYVLADGEGGADGYRVARATQNRDGTVLIGRPVAVPTPVTDWTIEVDGCPVPL